MRQKEQERFALVPFIDYSHIMCGRFILRTPSDALRQAFQLMRLDAHLQPRYNIAPTQPVAVIRDVDEERSLSLMHWGLIPSWAKDASFAGRMINARGETVAEKPSFRAAFKRRRCLIPVDGFYEWRKEGTKKQPYFIRMKDEQTFAFAALWETWNEIESCTIITTSANKIMQPLHDRMPVILPAENYDSWLSPEENKERFQKMLIKYPSDKMMYHPVSTEVNSPKHDTPDCIVSIAG